MRRPRCQPSAAGTGLDRHLEWGALSHRSQELEMMVPGERQSAVSAPLLGKEAAESPGRGCFLPHLVPAPCFRVISPWRYQRGRSAPQALCHQNAAHWQAQGPSPFQIHKIDAVLCSKTFKHQTGNLSSFMVAESGKELGQIK